MKPMSLTQDEVSSVALEQAPVEAIWKLKHTVKIFDTIKCMQSPGAALSGLKTWEKPQ